MIFRHCIVVAMAAVPFVAWVAWADSPVRSVKDLTGLAKSRRLNVSTSGVGQSPHMSSKVFRQKAGIGVTLVPFPGAAPAVTALLASRCTS